MLKTGITLVALTIILSSCNNQPKQPARDMSNPFFKEYATPFQVPPFNEIKLEHYIPAIDAGIADQMAEIKAITDNKEEPTFDNTILAFDQSGLLLNQVGNVFFNINSANTDDKMQELARQITPKLSAHRDNIALNKELFARIKSVYDRRNELKLNADQLLRY